ncbi:Purple acid phosphatase 7 [Lathyrus oleraceus]|uniref:Purple acid phosphatase 7 n=1 Tax=Pisum sativum TaxID=3888 RepID=A0A9D4YHG2_PEA|nr:Purple acid phosphatase 7 [Pisum sativum]
MGRVADELNIDLVVSTGDNFYDDGLTWINDPAFQYSFSDIYTVDSLQKQWYNGFTWNVCGVLSLQTRSGMVLQYHCSRPFAT